MESEQESIRVRWFGNPFLFRLHIRQNGKRTNMYILVASFIVQNRVHSAWMESLKQHCIPGLREQGFDRLTLTRLLAEMPTEEFTYNLQVDIPNVKAYQQVSEQILRPYGALVQECFGESVLFCASLLKRVELM